MSKSAYLAQRFLIQSQLPDAGWGYLNTATESYPEPTCYSLLALADTFFSPQKTLTWLASLVNAEGQLVLPRDDAPNWATAPLIITLVHLDALPEIRSASTNWLLAWKSQYIEEKQGSIRINPDIPGWSWISNTFSWVQPTSMAVLALKLAGLTTHPRVKEGEVLLLDRACQQGGWNFGNPVVFGSALEPTAVDTAIALFALQDVAEAADAIEKGLAVIESKAPQASSTLSLALGILCLEIFNRPVEQFVRLLEKRQSPDGSWKQNIWWTAVAAMALQVAEGSRNAFRIQKI
jgi:hypothetical protein